MRSDRRLRETVEQPSSNATATSPQVAVPMDASGAGGSEMPTAENTSRPAEAISAALNHFAEHRIFDPQIEVVVAGNPSESIRILSSFLNYPDPEVRWITIRLLAAAGRASSLQDDRRAVTDALVDALRDDSDLVWQHAATDLMWFRAPEFSPSAGAELVALVRQRATPEMIRVVGVADVRSATDIIDQFLDENSALELRGQPARYRSLDWAARLARARMGSEEDAKQITAEVEAERDDVLRVTKLLDDLAYTRSPEGLRVLIENLESNERLPQYSNVAPGSPYAQYALASLSRMRLEGFPVSPQEPGEFTGQQIGRARRWMATAENWQGKL